MGDARACSRNHERGRPARALVSRLSLGVPCPALLNRAETGYAQNIYAHESNRSPLCPVNDSRQTQTAPDKPGFAWKKSARIETNPDRSGQI